jgi:branched-chain amino acid transport system ATP-binding protein
MQLEVSKLDVRYGTNHANKSVDLHLEAGEIITVLGANGAGKSTLLRALSGATPISGGAILLDGKPIHATNTASRVKSGIALVPEGRQIFVSLTVEENLLMGAYTRPSRNIGQRVGEIFERFPNLAERRKASASVLSGGEQQMLAIGRAMLSEPKIMMLDEPSLGLSPILVEQLFELIEELNQSGISILLVEQNTQMALQIASRGYVLELGEVKASGPAQQLIDDPRLAEAYLGMLEVV